jgi:hypothetical protein
MPIRNEPLKRGRAEDWNAERVSRLDKREIQQLRENAVRLGQEVVVALCDQALKPRARKGG